MSETQTKEEMKNILDIFEYILTDYGFDKKDIEETSYHRKFKRLLRNYNVDNIEKAILDCEYYLDPEFLRKKKINFENDIVIVDNYLDKIGGTLYNRKFRDED
tara:strand:- start:21852 stop:22160 length:309 start_codon:yes stop_codon:yes gene_type:complete